MSAVASGSWGTAVGVAPPTAIVGGALMLFGARLASGCTRCYNHCLNSLNYCCYHHRCYHCYHLILLERPF